MADLLSAMPLEREVIGFFRPASADIIRRVKGVECILTADGEYALPSSTLSLSARLRVHNSELLTPAACQKHLHRRLVDASFQEALRPETRAALGIEAFDETHALRLMRGLVESSSREQQPLSLKMIREWCVLLYRAASAGGSGLGLSKDSAVSQLRQLPIIPLKGSRLGLISPLIFSSLRYWRLKPHHILSLSLSCTHSLPLPLYDQALSGRVQMPPYISISPPTGLSIATIAACATLLRTLENIPDRDRDKVRDRDRDRDTDTQGLTPLHTSCGWSTCRSLKALLCSSDLLSRRVCVVPVLVM